MKSYTFKAYGLVKEIIANYVPFDLANDHFNPSNGAWIDAGPNTFQWVEGNFFD